jgi:hypothetical protein
MIYLHGVATRSVMRLIGVLMVGVGAFLASMLPLPRSAGATVQSDALPRVSATSSDEEIRQAALATVRSEFVIRSGTPRVLLVRSVTQSDLPALGLGRVDFASVEKPPLMLVIIKGDFGSCNCPSIISDEARSKMRARYVGYLFDLWDGGAFWMLASSDGGAFRIALNDPSLPIVPTIPIPPTQAPLSPPLHYGDVAPTVAVPTHAGG